MLICFGNFIDDMFLVETGILVFGVHPQSFSRILFCWLRSEKLIFRDGRTYVIEKYQYAYFRLVNYFLFCFFLCLLVTMMCVWGEGGGGGGRWGGRSGHFPRKSWYSAGF